MILSMPLAIVCWTTPYLTFMKNHMAHNNKRYGEKNDSIKENMVHDN